MMKSWLGNCTDSSTALPEFLIVSLQCKGNPQSNQKPHAAELM
jgi:hypothetical protein